MAHLRFRHLTHKYKELYQFAPILGILGHRQVGKTTFLEMQKLKYQSFDDQDVYNNAVKDPKKFISSMNGKGYALDESQLVPGIFPALKERVRMDKRPGQFVLSGSVRFTSKANIRESLTGRIQYLEMLPFSISEMLQQNFENKISKLINAENADTLNNLLQQTGSELTRKRKAAEIYLKQGGLPGICFIRKDQTRNDKILDQLRTILDRDLRQIQTTTFTFDVLLGFVSYLAKNEGKQHQFQNAKRLTGISPITQKKILYALESLFLIRRLPIEGFIHGETWLMEDQAESHLLSEHRLSLEQQIMGMVYRCLRTQYFYDTSDYIQCFQFKAKSGNAVPLVFRNRDSCLGFVYSETQQISRTLHGVIHSFFHQYKNSKVIVLSGHTNGFTIQSDRVLICPYTAVL